jgi:FXSXX-COOH protein
MDSSEQVRGIVSELADVDEVPLADLRVMTDETWSNTLRRIVPDTPSQGVQVAAFNSSI